MNSSEQKADASLLKQLQESEELFSSTFYQASVGMVHVRMSDGRFVRANRKLCEMLGYSEEEVCHKTILEVTHPDDVQGDLDSTQRMVEGELSMFSMEKRLLRKDGSSVWTRLTAVSVARNAEGQATYGMAVCEDISQIKQTEQALQESESRFKTLADSAPVTIFVTDTHFKTMYVNRDWLDYTGLSFEESIGMMWQSAVHPDDLEAFMALVLQAFEKQESFRVEIRIKKADGRYGWMLMSGVPRYMPNEQFLGYVGTGVDIDDSKTAEAFLEHAKLQAESANRKKSEFLSLMSHELRTPLNSIIGFTEMLENGLIGELNAKQKEFAGYVSASGHHLLNLVNDLLDIAKIEAGKMTLYAEPVQLSSLISGIRSMMLEQARQKEVTLAFQVHPAIETVYVDPARFKQILINLLSNAIKFNYAGGTVFMRLYQSEDEHWLVGEVQDTGIGISSDKLAELFQKFYQVDTTAARSYEGTGLGLALTRDLVELHGGNIMVVSEEGIGTTFTFKLPVAVSLNWQGPEVVGGKHSEP